MVVGDGQQVEIPVLTKADLSEAVTQGDSSSRLMVEPVQASGVQQVKYGCKTRRCDGDRKEVEKRMNPHWREKLLARPEAPVPQTDTGRRGENPKMSEISIVKELGKMTP